MNLINSEEGIWEGLDGRNKRWKRHNHITIYKENKLLLKTKKKQKTKKRKKRKRKLSMLPSAQWFPKSRKWFLECVKRCIIYVLFLQSTPFSSPISKRRREELLPIGLYYLSDWIWENTYVHMKYTCTTICIERLLWKLSIADTLVRPFPVFVNMSFFSHLFSALSVCSPYW